MTRENMETVIPILPSLNFDETAQFYAPLGFTETGRAPDLLMLRRDGSELFFWPTDQRQLCEASGCYIRTQHVDALHAAFTQAGASIAPPCDRPWKMREFYLFDPHGNLIRFGMPLPG